MALPLFWSLRKQLGANQGPYLNLLCLIMCVMFSPLFPASESANRIHQCPPLQPVLSAQGSAAKRVLASKPPDVSRRTYHSMGRTMGRWGTLVCHELL